MAGRSRFRPLYLLAVLFSLPFLLASSPSGGDASAPVLQAPVQGAFAVSQAAQSDVSVRFLQVGLSGSITVAPLTADVNGDGEEEVLLGTSRGLYTLSGGSLLQYVPTSSSVTDIALLDDLTGNGQVEVAVAVGDTYFPNIRVYDSATGEKVWDFVPKQEVFIENLMWTEQQTLTFDLETVDLSSDNTRDVIATSGYRVYALDGRSGSLLWEFEASDNLWRIAATPDLDGDGVPDLAVGGQNGFLYVLDGKEGALLWKKRLVERYRVVPEKGRGSPFTVDRSVWDIVPVSVLGAPKAVVSSEDGMVRLVDLRDGTVHWEYQAIEYVDVLLARYYTDKQKHATSPGDFHFFNLRVSPAPDVTGDEVEEVLVSAFLGKSEGEQGQEPRGAGLFLINPATGRARWENTALELEQITKVDTTFLEEEPVLLLPSGTAVEVVNLKDGISDQTIPVASAAGVFPSDRYAVKSLGNGGFLLAPGYGDLLGVSSSGEVLWDYPRVSDVAVEQGDFTGDETQDILVHSRTYSQGKGRRDFDSRARVLYVIDGATRQKAWYYVMPYQEFAATGGIGGIQVAPDLNQDGKQDIVGFIQLPGDSGKSGEGYGGDSRIVALSGSDGAFLLRQPVVTQTYYGVWEELYKDPSVLEQRLREQFEAGVKKTWASQEEKHRQDFEKQLRADLDGQRGKGVSEKELASFERQRRDDFERWLPKGLASEEQSWRESFEKEQLPKGLENWREHLQKEEGGRRIDKRIVSLDILEYRNEAIGEGVGLVVGGTRDIFIISPGGELLWTKTYESWRYQDPFTGEENPEMKLGLPAGSNTSYRVPGDLNGDGIDDVVAFTGMKVVVGLSNLDLIEEGEFDFKPGQVITLEQGMDSREGRLTEDLDGDGIMDIFYLRWQENKAPIGVFLSSTTGKRLLEVEDYQPSQANQNVTLDLAAVDLDGDDVADTLLFQRWGGKGPPSLRVVSGRTSSVVWEFEGYREQNLFNRWSYRGPVMPAAPISDVTGDGIADLALVKSLPWQAGAQVVLYDVARDRVVKEIILEEIDSTRGQKGGWHPGLLVREMGDFNGDGFKELAVVTFLGDTEREKELRLMVVDLHQGQTVADFGVIGSDFIKLEGASQFGVVGLTGEFSFLEVVNDLRIASPTEGGVQTSPLAVQWTGGASGAFNQVFIDNVEVARTNENEFTTSVAQGEHELTVRSLDEYSRGAYRTVHFSVDKGSSAVAWAMGATALLVAVALGFPVSRLVTRVRRRRGRHG